MLPKNLSEMVEHGRPRPMYNSELHRFSCSILNGEEANLDSIGSKFLLSFDGWLKSSRLNRLTGLDSFHHRDVIQGVTSFIDDIYLSNPGKVYVLDREYMYHKRMFGDSNTVDDPSLIPMGSNLIIGMPFPFYGDRHPEMDYILSTCLERGISVYIDSAWIGCTRDLSFDYDHPSIQSVGFSLSKGLGLGYNRIGVRYSRARTTGPITLMNDHSMIPRVMCWWGIKFIERFGHDYLQDRYHGHYERVCSECGLVPSKSIHLAHQVGDGVIRPVGVREALRYLDENKNV